MSNWHCSSPYTQHPMTQPSQRCWTSFSPCWVGGHSGLDELGKSLSLKHDESQDQGSRLKLSLSDPRVDVGTHHSA